MTIRAMFSGLLVICLALLAGTDMASAQGQVPAEFQGDWVAASAACTAPARVRVAAASITLVNGADKETLGAVEVAGPGFFPPDYNGIQKVAISELSGDQPLSMTFNYQEKRGVALAEAAMPGPDRPGAAASNTLNAKLRKLNLAKRFPLHQVPLKKCPAAK